MRIARVFLYSSWLLMACGSEGPGITEPLPDNHELMVLETIPYPALGATTLTFSRDEADRRGVVELDGSSATGSITWSVWGPWLASSPTSRRLAYQGAALSGGQRGYDIYIRDWDAETGTSLGGPGGLRKDPSWTPDGTRIVYSEATEDFAFFSTSIVSQSPVGGASDRQVLWSTTRSCEFVGDPEQNAAGTLVFVYYAYRSPCTRVQTIARSTPPGVAEIIYTPITNIYSPTWSPSGAQIAFLETGVTGVGGAINVSVRLMGSDGSNVRTVTTGLHHGGFSEFDFSLCWSADALRIFFNRRDASSTSHIYSVSVADGTVTQITSAPGVRDTSVSCS